MESYSFSRSLNMEFLRNISGEQLIIRIYLLFSLCHLREEGSPPLGNNQILFINYRRRGRNDGCSRAGQHVVWKPAEVKNDTTMKYDLFAEFYGNASKKALYVVWLGSICPNSDNELESLGFQARYDDGYLDYFKDNATVKDLETITCDGYECELFDVLDETDYERIQIVARELEVIDDEGQFQSMGVMVGDTFVEFTDSEKASPVFFSAWNENNNCIGHFQVPVIMLKRQFNVLTLMEVKEKLEKMGAEKNWNYDELKILFLHNKSRSL